MRIFVFALAAALMLALTGCGQMVPSGSAPESTAPSAGQEEVLPPESSGEENSSQEDEIPPEPAEPGSGTQSPTNQEGQASASITQEEALALAENHFGEKDQATGNTFSIGFESMVTVDGVEYYNFRVSWLVNGDHMSYLTNYLVSLDGKERKEYLPQG